MPDDEETGSISQPPDFHQKSSFNKFLAPTKNVDLEFKLLTNQQNFD
jgi:hypothetical protein